MSFLKYLGRNFLLLLAIIADLISVSVWFYQSHKVPLDNGVWMIYLSNLLLTILALGLLFRVIYLQVVWGRKKRYALAFNIINQGFAELHELERSEEPEEIKLNSLEKLCDAFSVTFTSGTTAQCNICIKVLSKSENRLEVKTLARDSTSKKSRPMQQKDTDKNLHHWVDANTDFSTIIQNMGSSEKRYFCSNNLPWLNDYKNTRMPDSDKHSSNSFIYNQIRKTWGWPLPYRSSLVVPIVPGHFNSTNSEKLAGFLCIDSPQINVFKEKYDLPIAQGVADGLYNVVVKYYNLI